MTAYACRPQRTDGWTGNQFMSGIDYLTQVLFVQTPAARLLPARLHLKPSGGVGPRLGAKIEAQAIFDELRPPARPLLSTSTPRAHLPARARQPTPRPPAHNHLDQAALAPQAALDQVDQVALLLCAAANKPRRHPVRLHWVSLSAWSPQQRFPSRCCYCCCCCCWLCEYCEPLVPSLFPEPRKRSFPTHWLPPAPNNHPHNHRTTHRQPQRSRKSLPALLQVSLPEPLPALSQVSLPEPLPEHYAGRKLPGCAHMPLPVLLPVP
ncbi:hypothetical protein PMIN06_005668 [Paraphaeosphaeria minitans]